MSLFDRLLGRHDPSRDNPAWEDAGVEDVVRLAAGLATAWDADGDDPRVTASRAAVLGAVAAAGGTQPDRVPDTAARSTRAAGMAPGIRRGGRRPVFALAAAAVLLALGLGTVAAAAPGGPLYDTRIAAESLLLPSAPDDRALAEIERLDARMAEADAAAARGDATALRAVLSAYARIADEAAAIPGVGPGVRAALAARVRVQLEVMSAIGAPDPALDATREQARIAARRLLGALGAPDGGGPDAGPSPMPSGGPTGEPPTGSPAPGPTPTAPNGPGSSSGPAGSGGMPTAGASAGPGGSSSPAGSGGPAGASPTGPEATPTPTPRSTGGPSMSPGGGGSGSSSGPSPSASATQSGHP